MQCYGFYTYLLEHRKPLKKLELSHAVNGHKQQNTNKLEEKIQRDETGTSHTEILRFPLDTTRCNNGDL